MALAGRFNASAPYYYATSCNTNKEIACQFEIASRSGGTPTQALESDYFLSIECDSSGVNQIIAEFIAGIMSRSFK